MAGCTNYYLQYAATVQEADAERIIISKNNAKNLVVGSTVSIGNANALNGEGKPNNDRGQSGIHEKLIEFALRKLRTMTITIPLCMLIMADRNSLQLRLLYLA